MIQTRKIKNLVEAIKKILNNNFHKQFFDKMPPFHLYAQYLLIYGFIETRNWLEDLSPTIKQELINDSWNVCIGDAKSNNFYENYRKIDGKFSNELKKNVNEFFTSVQPFSIEDPILADPILNDIQNLINVLQYLHFFISDSNEENKERKASGSYFTPPGVVMYILNRLEEDVLVNLGKSDNIRILDYSCGMGTFLFYAAAFISLQNFENIHFSFWGFDNDPYIIEICKYLLKLLKFHSKFGTMFQNISFLNMNSLEPLNKDQWNFLFNNISKNSNKFPLKFNENIVDIIITNPPYKSWGLGRVGTLQSDLVEKYRKRFSNTAEYKISFYSIFIERAVQFLKLGGWAAFVLPDSFLMGKYYQKLRIFLLSKCILLEICLFEKNFWKQANIGLPVILIIQKKLEKSKKLNLPMRSVQCILKDEKVLTLEEYTMDQKIFIHQPKKRFRIFFSEETELFAKKFEKNAIPLKKFFEIHHGIRSRTGIGKERITSNLRRNNKWKRGIISGNSIVPYLINYQGRFILVKPDLLYSGGYSASQIESEKIILRRTGDRLIAAVDTEGFYLTNTLLYLIPKNDINPPLSLYALCVILNSVIFNKYYQLITLKKNRSLPQVEIDTLYELPLKIDKKIFQQLDEGGRILQRIRKTNQIHPLNKEDQKDIDELLDLFETTVENLYID